MSDMSKFSQRTNQAGRAQRLKCFPQTKAEREAKRVASLQFAAERWVSEEDDPVRRMCREKWIAGAHGWVDGQKSAFRLWNKEIEASEIIDARNSSTMDAVRRFLVASKLYSGWVMTSVPSHNGIDLYKIRLETKAPRNGRFLKLRCAFEVYVTAMQNRTRSNRLYDSDPDHRLMQLMRMARVRAKKLGIEYSLDVEDMISRLRVGRCEATGMPFDFDKKRGPFVFSLDQTIPRGGYTRENTRLVCWMYNSMKGAWSESEILQMAEAIVHKNTGGKTI